MFFLLSKLLTFVLAPMVWVVVALVLAVRARSPEGRRRWLLAVFGLLLVFSNPALSNYTFYLWEVPPVPIRTLKRYDAAVLLSGITSPARRDHDRVFIRTGSDRLLHTVLLWRRGRIGRIIVSGGSGELGGSLVSEAEQLREVLLLCGVPDSIITLETRSRNTKENAAFTAELLRQRPALAPHGRLLLVTSAFHMRRAAGCFQQAGLQFDVFPADFAGQPVRGTINEFVPSTAAILGWERLIHEVAGYLVYRLSGYS